MRNWSRRLHQIFGFLLILATTGTVVAGDPPCCDLPVCSTCSKPTWSLTADSLFLARGEPTSRVLAFNTVDPAQNVNADGFDFNLKSGFDLTLTRSLGANHAIQLRYFGVDGLNSTQTVLTTDNDLLSFNASPPVFANAGNSIQSQLSSELHNAELSLTKALDDCFTLSAGFRYAELDERIQMTLSNSAIPFTYRARTQNRLYGGQLGLDALLWETERFSLDVLTKAGIFGNSGSQEGLTTTGLAGLTAAGSDDDVSFIGELGLTSTTQLRECLSMRVGYRLLWFDGVADATRQLAATNFNTGTGFHGSGDVFFHGVFVGLQLVR